MADSIVRDDDVGVAPQDIAEIIRLQQFIYTHFTCEEMDPRNKKSQRMHEECREFAEVCQFLLARLGIIMCKGVHLKT